MHTAFMKRALELALLGRYTCRPNPMVGALITEGGQIIAEGWHKAYGGPHAEVDALSKLPPNKDLSACTLYVTLEPCAHFGKTPPCSQALIDRKIGRVVTGSGDPNPLVAGKGIAAMRSAGIEVIEGVLKKECGEANAVFFKYITKGLPFLTIKSALTLDGRIAADSGHSFWVSGEESRSHAQELRAWNMGILAGIGTVLADNPLLTCRLEGLPSPVRIIADSHLQSPVDSKLIGSLGKAPLWIACLKEAPEIKQKALLKAGAELIFCPEEGGHISLSYLLKELAKKGLDSLLSEGGGVLNAALLKQGLADRLALYLAPKILGSGIPFICGEKTASMEEALPFIYQKVTALGGDLFIEAAPLHKEKTCSQAL